MPAIDLSDETFVAAPPHRVAAAVHDQGWWAQLWPDLDLTVVEDRGPKGIRWTCAGALVGSCEVWLQVHGHGVIVHCYLRGDRPGLAGGNDQRALRRRQRQVKALMFAFKDRLEAAI
ncbi:MAG: polyketide cyclase / dehydrase and lipid transport [Actinomycetota bacterium]|nr:polyketide cyclase / dehydrase and lipid transport [Actinomycetota bacterium]